MLNRASTVFITSPPPNVTSYDVFLTTAGDVLIATGVPTRTPVPAEPGEFISHVDLTIVGGFGKYAEATGTMTFDGVSHTGTVPRTADFIYKGTVCGPNVKVNRTNRSRRSIFHSMGGSDVILFGERCARLSYCSQRQPRFPTKTGLKSSISGPFCESTPIGELEFSLSTLQGPRKCASLVTEQFRGDERGRNRRAIHGHKRAARAR